MKLMMYHLFNGIEDVNEENKEKLEAKERIIRAKDIEINQYKKAFKHMHSVFGEFMNETIKKHEDGES